MFVAVVLLRVSHRERTAVWLDVAILTKQQARAIEDHLSLLQLMLRATRTLESNGVTAHILTSVTHELHRNLVDHSADSDSDVGRLASALASSLERRLAEQSRWKTGNVFVAAALLSPGEDLSRFLDNDALNEARALLVADSLQFDEPLPGFPSDIVGTMRAAQLAKLGDYFADPAVKAMWQASGDVLAFWKSVSGAVVQKSDSTALKGLSGIFASFKVRPCAARLSLRFLSLVLRTRIRSKFILHCRHRVLLASGSSRPLAWSPTSATSANRDSRSRPSYAHGSSCTTNPRSKTCCLTSCAASTTSGRITELK